MIILAAVPWRSTRNVERRLLLIRGSRAIRVIATQEVLSTIVGLIEDPYSGIMTIQLEPYFPRALGILFCFNKDRIGEPVFRGSRHLAVLG